MVNMEALDAVNLVGFVYHILLVVGATIILPYYRNEHAVRARGVTFIIFLLWLTALRMPLPILDVLRTRDSSSDAACSAMLAVSLLGLTALVTISFSRLFRFAAFTVIQHTLRQCKDALDEATPQSTASAAGALDDVAPITVHHDEAQEPLTIGVGPTHTDSEATVNGNGGSDASQIQQWVGSDFSSGPQPTSNNFSAPNSLVNFIQYSKTPSVSSLLAFNSPVFPNIHFSKIRSCGCRCSARRMRCLFRTADFRYNVIGCIVYLGVISAVIVYTSIYHRAEYGRCTFTRTGVILPMLCLVPVLVGNWVVAVPLLRYRDRVGLRGEMLWSVLIVTACGIVVSISSPNQNNDEYRYIRRVALLWAQNLLLSLMVFTPLCLAIRARKKRKIFSVHPAQDSPMLENVQSQPSLRLRVSKAEGPAESSVALDTQDSAVGSTGSTFLVTLPDVWSNERLQAEFFEHLRAEYKLHYATFYDETNAWTIRHTISHGLVAFCQFYLRICNVYFSPVSVVDIFTGASMYNHIWKVAGKAREVVHRLVRAWRNQQLPGSSQLYTIPETAEVEVDDNGNTKSVQLRLFTGIKNCFMNVSLLEYQVVTHIGFRVGEAVAALYSARVAVWREMEATSLPQFIMSPRGHAALLRWREDRQQRQNSSNMHHGDAAGGATATMGHRAHHGAQGSGAADDSGGFQAQCADSSNDSFSGAGAPFGGGSPMAWAADDVPSPHIIDHHDEAKGATPRA